jgi:hypothetical protein
VFLFLLLFFFGNAGEAFAGSVVINEFLANPDKDQWVELFNTSDSSVDISSWFIDDSAGSQKFTIPEGIIIAPGQILIFSSGLFNLNTSSPDSVQLFHGDVVEDSYHYDNPLAANTSLGRRTDGDGEWVVFTSPSKGASNNTSAFSPIPSDTPTFTPIPATATSFPTATKVPTPTRVPTQTKIPTPTKVPTPTKSGQSGNKTPTTKPTVISKLVSATSFSASPTAMSDKAASESQNLFPTAVLGASTQSKDAEKSNSISKNMVKSMQTQKIPLMTIALVVIGVLLLGCGILFYLKKRKEQEAL